MKASTALSTEWRRPGKISPEKDFFLLLVLLDFDSGLRFGCWFESIKGSCMDEEMVVKDRKVG